MKNKTSNEVILEGVATSPGIAIGPAFVFKPYRINLSELNIKIEDVKDEFRHFENARNQVLEHLEYARSESEENYGEQFSMLFESQQAFLQDEVLLREIKMLIIESRYSAAFAVQKVLSEKSEHFINLENLYFRERAFDIIDLKQKLIGTLLGIDIDYHLSGPAIVVADMLSPSDTVHFNRNLILGFLTDKGGRTAHAAILARGLRIPSVVNGVSLSKLIQNDDLLIIDGFSGKIIINPTKSRRQEYEELREKHHQFEKDLYKDIDQDSVTTDQAEIELLANIEFLHEVNDVKLNRANGVGLFRTESIFIEREGMPGEDEQFEIYRKLAEQMAPLDVVIRTVDLGGDKLLDGYSASEEPNPFLGWRAIRFCLDRPDLFKTQLRAILRASAFGKIKILIPMVSSLNEILETKELLNEVRVDLQSSNIKFDDKIELGLMVETPATAIMASQFAGHVDYFSIGTNDLTQYVLAIDRTNNRVADSYSTFNPSVLKLIEETIKAANESSIPVSLCGEFSSIPEAVPLILGMGLRSLSMNPFYIPETKRIIRSVSIPECEDLCQSVKKLDDDKSIEAACKSFLSGKIPELEF